VFIMGWLRTALLLAALAAVLAPQAAHAQIVPKACHKVHKDDFVIEKGALDKLCTGTPLTKCAPRCKTALQRVGGCHLQCCGEALRLAKSRLLPGGRLAVWLTERPYPSLLQLGYQCTSFLKSPTWV
jgi:hypothetical protein